MKKKLGVGALVVLLLLAALRVGVGMYASAQWSRYEVQWANEVKVERQRAASVRRPMIHGLTPIDSNVTPRYMKIFAPRTSSEDTAVIASAYKNGASPSVLAPLFAARRAALHELREALRCCRCDWETPWESAASAPLPNLIAARNMTNLLVIEGRSLPPREAAERALDAIRIGTDFEAGATLIHKMIGLAILHTGLDALGNTLVRAAPGELDLDALERDYERLVADRPGVADLIRGERLGLRSFLDSESRGSVDPLGARVVLQLGIVEVDGLEQALESALTLDRASRDKAFDEVEASAAASWNPLTKMTFPNIKTAVQHVLESIGEERLIATALRVEKLRGADGTYPEKLDDLPLDPGSGAPIGYKRSEDAKGWTLSCKRFTLSRHP